MIGKGGNQRIPEGIAKALKGEVRMGTKVIGLRTDSAGVEVQCQDGTVHRARFAVCSVPVPVLQQIKVDPILKGVQAQAVKTMSTYARCTQVHIVPTKPFWLEDGLPVGMWTDGAAGLVAANTLGDRPDDVTSITAYSRGPNATYMDSIGAEAAKAVAVHAIETARPAAKGRLKAVHMHSWQLDEFAFGADRMIWGPGQVPKFFGDLWQAHGRIHFCGQHTAPTEFGMEGAMESGERVAREVLKRI
jgi:monoamine oxidase